MFCQSGGSGIVLHRTKFYQKQLHEEGVVTQDINSGNKHPSVD